MAAKELPHTVLLARSWKGLEQVTIELKTDNPDELEALIAKAAAACNQRQEFYDAKQREYEEMMQRKIEESNAADDAESAETNDKE